MSSALRSVGLLDVLSSTSAGPSVALAEKRQMRLVSTPVCAASLRNLVRNAGWERRRPGGSKIYPTTTFRLKRKVPNMAKTKLAAIANPLPARRRRSQDALFIIGGTGYAIPYFDRGKSLTEPK